jgi:hypothetical protein
MISNILKRLESTKHRDLVKKSAEGIFSFIHFLLFRVPGETRCRVCGAKLITINRAVLSDALIKDWRLDKKWRSFINQREGEICISCGSSLRIRQLANCLLQWIQQRHGIKTKSMCDLLEFDLAKQMSIAEINSCGSLHSVLKKFPNHWYSEFQPRDSSIRHEDLLALTYEDESFDLVLHSDTLEHVSNIKKAFSEINRILKTEGVTIFSVPIVRDGRKTLVRACIDAGELKHLHKPSYHGGSLQSTKQYLVCYEFGEDLFEIITSQGFELSLFEHYSNPSAFTIIAKKVA